MPDKTYTYDPARIGEYGKDRMRFELGDVMVEGGPETCYLTDEEIGAAIECHAKRWKRAKLALVESVLFRFSYEVDTKAGPLSLSLSKRFECWKALHEQLKKSVGASWAPSVDPASIAGGPYFYTGMMENPDGTEAKHVP